MTERTQVGTCTKCGAVMPIANWPYHREKHAQEAKQDDYWPNTDHTED